MPNRIFLLFLLTSLSVVQAADIGNLYRAEVAVSDQGQTERNRAIKAGLLNVLVKVTGNRNIMQKPAAQTFTAKASRFVQQYRYRTVAAQATTESAGSGRYLQISFDKLAVDRELRKQGLPVWGKSRPQVLAWIGFERKGKRTLLNPESSPQISVQFKQLAANRGIPFLMPLMDLEDQAAVSASDLWGTFEKPVREASQRYMADIILLVTVKSAAGNYWSSKWSLIDGNGSTSWQEKSNKLNTMLEDGMNEMSDRLARTYAPAGGSQTEALLMQVSAVNSFEELVRLQQYLDRQETVQSFQVRAVKNDKVIIALNLRGGLQAFTQAMNLSGFLMPENDLLPEPRENALNQPIGMQPEQQEQQQQQQQQQSVAMLPRVMPLVAEIQLYYQMR